MVLRRIKDRVRERLGVSIHEVDFCDNWQRSELGCAVVSGDRGKAAQVLDQVVRIATSAGGSEIVAVARDVTTFASEPVPYALVDERTGAGDKAQVQDDSDWIPALWREDSQ